MSYAVEEATAKAMGHAVATQTGTTFLIISFRSTSKYLFTEKSNKSLVNYAISFINADLNNFISSTYLRSDRELAKSSKELPGVSDDQVSLSLNRIRRRVTFQEPESEYP